MIAIRSDGREYLVINNVPRMLPEVGEKKKGACNRWEKLLHRLVAGIKGGQSEDEPSVESDPVAGYVGNMMSAEWWGFIS